MPGVWKITSDDIRHGAVHHGHSSSACHLGAATAVAIGAPSSPPDGRALRNARPDQSDCSGLVITAAPERIIVRAAAERGNPVVRRACRLRTAFGRCNRRYRNATHDLPIENRVAAVRALNGVKAATPPSLHSFCPPPPIKRPERTIQGSLSSANPSPRSLERGSVVRVRAADLLPARGPPRT
jgi:hypothetical protein